MALADGSHLVITSGGTDYAVQLDREAQPPYDHFFERLIANRTAGAGLPGRQNLRSDLLPWAFVRFTGGENRRFYEADDPTTYDYATGTNTRVAGVLKGTPTRTDSTAIAATTGSPTQVFLANSQNLIWVASMREVSSMSDPTGTSWTVRNDLAANRVCTGATGGNDYFFQLVYDTVTNERWISRVNTSARSNVTVATAAPSNQRYTAIALAGPYIYFFAEGGVVRRVDSTDSGIPLAEPSALYKTGVSVSATTGFSGMVATDTGIVLFHSVAGDTLVHEISGPVTASPVGAPIWGPITGFTATAIGFAAGVIYLAGYYGDGTNSTRAFLWGMDNRERIPTKLGYFRVENASTSQLVPVSIAAGDGEQAIIGMQSGEVFIYDKEQNAISHLDTRSSDGNLGAVGNFKGRRFGAYMKTSDTSIRVSAWKGDFDSTTSSATLFTGKWDYDLGEVLKELNQYDVTFKPITGSETITISFQLDDAGSYTDLTQITSATSGASTGRVSQAVSNASNTRKFRQHSTKIATTNGAEVYSVVAWAEPLDDVEYWQFAIDIHDEHSGQRPSSKQRAAQDILDLFLNRTTGLKFTKNVATFTVGVEDPEPKAAASNLQFVGRIVDARYRPKRLPTQPGFTGMQGTLTILIRVVP